MDGRRKHTATTDYGLVAKSKVFRLWFTMDILTSKRIEELKNTPYVMAVGQTSILLTAECIQTIYSRYVTDPTISGIEEALKELGFSMTDKEYILPESLFVRFMELPPDIEVELAYWKSEPDSNKSSQNSKKAKANETKAGKNSQGEEASSGGNQRNTGNAGQGIRPDRLDRKGTDPRVRDSADMIPKKSYQKREQNREKTVANRTRITKGWLG